MLTYVIIGLTCIISYLALQDRQLFMRLSHRPYTETRLGEYYR